MPALITPSHWPAAADDFRKSLQSSDICSKSNINFLQRDQKGRRCKMANSNQEVQSHQHLIFNIVSIKNGSLSLVCIYLIKLHISCFWGTVPATTRLPTYLDLEPGVLRAETDVAGGDQVDACQRDDAPSQHHNAFPLRSRGAKPRHTLK